MSECKEEALRLSLHRSNEGPASDRAALIEAFRSRGIMQDGHPFERVVESDVCYLLDAIIAAGFRRYPTGDGREVTAAALHERGLRCGECDFEILGTCPACEARCFTVADALIEVS